MIAAEIIALLVLALSPAASQATYIQDPTGGETEVATAAAPSDVRLVLRQTSGETASEPPPGMVEIPRGQVLVGTDPANIKTTAKTDEVLIAEFLAETPRHTADIAAFYIDKTEVTNLQWKVFLEATGRKPSPALVEFGWPTGDVPEGQEHFPITNVNFPEIRDYLAWCGKRLPTEQEWTRAARGDDEREYPWGSDWEGKRCQSAASAQSGAVAVGNYPDGASPFGVLDMAGNVFEWVDSPFAAFPGFEPLTQGSGKKTTTITPQFNNSWRVIKGGSFTTIKQFTRIDVRLGQSIVESDAALGFRCARSTTPGLEAVRNGLKLLGSPHFVKTGLDETDVIAREIDSYDDEHKVITGYRYLAFAHRAPVKGPSLTSLRKTARDEFLPLGVLVSSEGIRMPDMDDKTEIDTALGMPAATAEQRAAKQAALERVQRVLPAGEYTLLFKSEGESKAFKEKQKDKDGSKSEDKGDASDGDAAKPADKPNGKDKKKKPNGEPEATEAAPAAAASEEAMVPWPGLASIHDVEEDVDYPQDVDLILFLNANNVVVSYLKPLDITEEEIEDVVSTRSEDGKSWTIEFSLNQQTSKKGPRFKFGLELAGQGL